ncbi:hypothetical protein [Bosea sp. (in: a-proteobacteria)]|uniref:hypothetical protein n=1 Tax=Bosea sp. (in: a-proteobacteria) TaxID=1871050 RepID=UPI002B4A4C7B|nr:hypothetical protein [Bosea sp. (in: a-proteobacteria)]WRH59309.1 MAG: hypothetical protein RSE11_05880 [Bosea sp. (in: a-proteobacteria)]
MHTTSILVSLSEATRSNLAACSLEAALRAGISEDEWSKQRSSCPDGCAAFDLCFVIGAGQEAAELLTLPGDATPAADGRRPFRVDLNEHERDFIAQLARHEAAAAHIRRDDWEAQRRIHPAGRLSADAQLAIAALIGSAYVAAFGGGDDAEAIKERVRAIITAPSAASNERLAQHLAYSTDLPAETAIGILNAATPPAPPPAVAQPSERVH